MNDRNESRLPAKDKRLLAQQVWQRASLLLVAGAGAVYIWRKWLPDSRSELWDAVSLSAVLAVAFGWLIIKPNLLQKIRSIKTPVLEIELSFYEKTDKEAGEDEHYTGESEERWLNARLKLEQRIAYLAMHTLPDHLPLADRNALPGEERPFTNVGWLFKAGLLNEGEAQRASVLLSSPRPVKQAGRSQMALLGDVENLAQTLRARVFRRIVEKYLRAEALGPVDEKRDRLALTHSGVRITVWPTWGPDDGKLAKGRLAQLESEEGGGIVVIPTFPGSNDIAADGSNSAAIKVTLTHLHEAVSECARRKQTRLG
jgi:hypothetical protein